MSQHLADANAHLDTALEHQANDRHSAARRSIKDAQRCINRAIDEAGPADHDPIANPTAAAGAQTSNGQQPRNYSPEAIRARDQQVGIDLCFRERQRQMRGFRK
jgi:hypothetical protein